MNSTSLSTAQKRRPALLRVEETLAHTQAMKALPRPKRARRSFIAPPSVVTGQPRPGGRLAHFSATPIFEDGLVYVSLEGERHRRAVLGEGTFQRLTARSADGPWLTRSRWWLDADGFVRAYSLHEARPMTQGVLVAAAILGAEPGEVIEVPADPCDLRISALRRLDSSA